MHCIDVVCLRVQEIAVIRQYRIQGKKIENGYGKSIHCFWKSAVRSNRQYQ